MRRLGARLGPLWFGGLCVFGCAAPAQMSHPADRRVVAANAYGDTVWFDSEEMTVGSPVVIVGPHGGSSSSPHVTYASAWGRTRGTPLMIAMRDRDPAPAADEIIERALRFPTLGLGHTDPPNEWNLTTRESSAFDNDGGRRLESWSMAYPPEDTSTVRVLFVVIGISDSTVAAPLRQSWQEPWGRNRSPGDPIPIRVDQHLRPFDIPIADRILTARLVGEFRADLKHRRIELVPQPPAIASTVDNRWRWGPCRLTR